MIGEREARTQDGKRAEVTPPGRDQSVAKGRPDASPAGALENRLVALLPRLLGCIRRHLQYHEALGDLRPREVEPEELAVETISRLLQIRDRAPTGRKLYPWLCRVAYQTIEEEVNRRQAERRHVAASLDDPLISHTAERAFDEPVRRLLDVLPAPGPLPEEVIVRREFQDYLESQVNHLPRELALALFYHDLERVSLRELAGLFQITEAEARRRVRLARASLAEALTRDGWVNVPPPASLFRARGLPSPERCRQWVAAAAERAGAAV